MAASPPYSNSFAPTSPSSSSGSRSRSPSPQPIQFSDSNPRPSLPPSIAFNSLRKLIALNLNYVGFDAVEPDALEDLEGICLAFLQALLSNTNAYTALARRTVPTPYDVLASVDQLGLGTAADLQEEVAHSTALYDLAGPSGGGIIKYERKRNEKEQAWLESDDEDDDEDPTSSVSSTIKKLEKETLVAPYLPPLPAKHSYRQTPVFPKSSLIHPSSILSNSSGIKFQPPSSTALAHLSTLRSRLNNSQLVADSLRNLIRATSIRRTGAGVEEAVEEEHPEEEEDVVDFETEWYKAESMEGGGGGKRRKLVIRVGLGEDKEALGRDEELEKVKNREIARAGAGAGKRRRWRV